MTKLVYLRLRSEWLNKEQLPIPAKNQSSSATDSSLEPPTEPYG